LVACKESNQALGSQEAVDWISGLPHFLGPNARQSTLHTGPRDTSESSVSTGPASGGRNARLRLHAWGRSARRRVVLSHVPLLPLTAQPLLSLSLLSLFLSLSSPKPPDDFSSTADNCTDRGGPTASPLPRIVIAEAVPHIEGEQPSGRTSTAACKMSVSTLNPHLVHSVSLHDVRRRALDDMHSRSTRFRVEGQYCSAGVFSPFVALMMCAAARVRVRSIRCR
jgi:hypothetical protein